MEPHVIPDACPHVIDDDDPTAEEFGALPDRCYLDDEADADEALVEIADGARAYWRRVAEDEAREDLRLRGPQLDEDGDPVEVVAEDDGWDEGDA